MDEELNSGLGELRDRVGNLEQGLAENTATTKRIESDTAEMLDIFRSAKGGFKVLSFMAVVVKWAVGTAAAAAAVWVAIKGGGR